MTEVGAQSGAGSASAGDPNIFELDTLTGASAMTRATAWLAPDIPDVVCAPAFGSNVVNYRVCEGPRQVVGSGAKDLLRGWTTSRSTDGPCLCTRRW